MKVQFRSLPVVLELRNEICYSAFVIVMIQEVPKCTNFCEIKTILFLALPENQIFFRLCAWLLKNETVLQKSITFYVIFKIMIQRRQIF
jgi:hypothetical protein